MNPESETPLPQACIASTADIKRMIAKAHGEICAPVDHDTLDICSAIVALFDQPQTPKTEERYSKVTVGHEVNMLISDDGEQVIKLGFRNPCPQAQEAFEKLCAFLNAGIAQRQHALPSSQGFEEFMRMHFRPEMNMPPDRRADWIFVWNAAMKWARTEPLPTAQTTPQNPPAP